MKRQIWSVFFTVFFRLPIYESIAAVFWQSASYVLVSAPSLAPLIIWSTRFTSDAINSIWP